MSYNYFTYDYLYEIEGADISTWQQSEGERIDWDLLSSRVAFLFLRGLYTKYLDYDFEDYYNNLKNYPMLPVGYYQYLKVRGSSTRMKTQFEKLQWLVDQYGMPALGLVLDIEENPDNLSKTVFGDVLAKYYNWCFQEWGEEHITTYTRTTFWDYVLRGYKTDYPKKTKLMIARYHDGIPVPYDSVIGLPADWEDVNNPVYGTRWHVWQHSADGNGLGDVFGVASASIDLLRFVGDNAAFYKMFNGAVPQKVENPLLKDEPDPPDPPDPPVPSDKCMEFVVTTDTLNVRSKPSTYGSIVGKLKRSTKVVLTENIHGYEGWGEIKEGEFAGNFIAVSYRAQRLAEPVE